MLELQAECDFTLVINNSFYWFGIRSCLATNHKQTLKDAIQHDVPHRVFWVSRHDNDLG